jgi:very-short-patch-repair endonuclease
LLEFQKQSRKKQTPWEHKLWYFIRAKRLAGLKFKRQVRIGPYVVDFCCREIKMIIELDGGQHDELLNRAVDTQRGEFLAKEGYQVIRFWNNEIEFNMEGILNRLLELSGKFLPTPKRRTFRSHPFPRRRGEK